MSISSGCGLFGNLEFEKRSSFADARFSSQKIRRGDKCLLENGVHVVRQRFWTFNVSKLNLRLISKVQRILRRVFKFSKSTGARSKWQLLYVVFPESTLNYVPNSRRFPHSTPYRIQGCDWDAKNQTVCISETLTWTTNQDFTIFCIAKKNSYFWIFIENWSIEATLNWFQRRFTAVMGCRCMIQIRRWSGKWRRSLSSPRFVCEFRLLFWVVALHNISIFHCRPARFVTLLWVLDNTTNRKHSSHDCIPFQNKRIEGH